ncbi:hypothetical protein GCM10025868_13120 [Angustibacter aerolatus]|uniref:Uncharacterized protein n=1 Tax=Angustibacter aerolatus TaxID=1162965 RepID=A0ABQ6JE51_9ACTN|nr:hypothetical protein GCM10025868_13120 [Angustibacter aerolatus]
MASRSIWSVTTFSCSSASLDRLDGVAEVGADVVDAGHLHLLVAVEQVLHHHHRVVALLDGLRVEVRGHPGHVEVVEPDRDRHVLLRGRELVADLLTQQVEEGGAHGTRAY